MPNREDVEVNLHFANGHVVETELESLDTEDPYDCLEDLIEEFSSRPAWRMVGDVLCFTGALSAISLR